MLHFIYHMTLTLNAPPIICSTLQNLLSAAVVIGSLRVNRTLKLRFCIAKFKILP